ncbi:hypothetical protein QN400_24890, partial [Pseudomonas sp. RTC3]|nr:hypothetical protein [Pseudomonas sp. RTC3]
HFTALTEQQQACQLILAQLLGDHSSAEQWQLHVDQAVEQAHQAEASAHQELQNVSTARVQLTT